MKYTASLLAATIFTSLAAPAIAAEVQVMAQNPVIELNVVEQINAAPDTATFSTGVEAKAKTATQALRDNSAKVRALIQQIKALGIADKDIQTSGINLNADYTYNQATRENRFTGYRVFNQVSVIVRDMDKLGEILDSIVSEGGATNLNGPYFSIDDDNEIKKLARQRGLKRAEEQAMVYAQAEGYSRVRILSVSESLRNTSSMPALHPVSARGAWNAGLESDSVPVQAGQVGTTIILGITYEMIR